MLIFGGLKWGDEVFIDGGRVVLRIVEVRRNRISLGFQADPSIRIDRKKLHSQRETVKCSNCPEPSTRPDGLCSVCGVEADGIKF